MRQVVESRDVPFYEQFGPNCIPGLSPYDGSPYIADITPAINSDMSREAGNSLHPLVPPAVATRHENMVFRPRQVAECIVTGVVPLGGRESSDLSKTDLPLGSLVLPFLLVLPVKC